MTGTAVNWDLEPLLAILARATEQRGITHIITFDALGVSSHPNHISTHHAVRYRILFILMSSYTYSNTLHPLP
ncbi:MAG: hypothetical protein WDW36_003865 [Sanguina aurantia]